MTNYHLCHILFISTIHPNLHIQTTYIRELNGPSLLLFNVTFPTESQLEFLNFVLIKYFGNSANKQIANIWKTLWPLFLLIEFNCLKVAEPLSGVRLLLTTKHSLPGTHLISLGKMKLWDRFWSHLVVLNPGPLEWG